MRTRHQVGLGKFHAELARRAKDFASAISRGQDTEYSWFL